MAVGFLISRSALARRIATGTGLVAILLGAPALTATARADEAARPIPTDDDFFAYAGGEYVVDVLANDTTSFLSSGQLTLCGVSVDPQAGRVVYADIDEDDPSQVYLETSRTAAGTVTFTYDACQGSQRATSTVTVTIERLAPLKVTRKTTKRGRLVVRNPNDVDVAVLWGSPTTATADGKRRVPAGGTVVIKVRRHRISWVGYLRDRGAVIIVGDDTIGGIKLPPEPARAARTIRRASTSRASVGRMHETDDEIAELQALLDRSHARATEHLRDIITSDRVLSARDLAALLTGMKVLSLATVTAAGEPRISAVDGHFLHGTWSFSTSGTAAKARHLEVRPAVSVAHVDHEELAVFSHGHVTTYAADDPDLAPVLEHWTAHYGGSPLEWGDDIRLYRYAPTWMVGYAWKRNELMAARGLA